MCLLLVAINNNLKLYERVNKREREHKLIKQQQCLIYSIKNVRPNIALSINYVHMCIQIFSIKKLKQIFIQLRLFILSTHSSVVTCPICVYLYSSRRNSMLYVY